MSQTKPCEWLDADGYPVELTLTLLREWPQERGYKTILEFIHLLWRWPDIVQIRTPWQGCTEYYFATGGWSGNESLIEALAENKMFMAACWLRTCRGGLHVFRVAEKGEEAGS